jgi:hypothetical protein
MSNRVNCDGVGFDREQHAPVAGTQPHSGHAFERLYVASASFGECRQLEVDLRARSDGKLAPLAGRSGSERDLFHTLKSHNAIKKSSKESHFAIYFVRVRLGGIPLCAIAAPMPG